MRQDYLNLKAATTGDLKGGMRPRIAPVRQYALHATKKSVSPGQLEGCSKTPMPRRFEKPRGRSCRTNAGQYYALQFNAGCSCYGSLMTLRLPNHTARREFAPLRRIRPRPISVAGIFAHVVLGVDQRLLPGGRQAEFAWRHDDLEAAATVEQMHGPQSVGASLNFYGERLDFRQTGVAGRQHSRECNKSRRADRLAPGAAGRRLRHFRPGLTRL